MLEGSMIGNVQSVLAMDIMLSEHNIREYYAQADRLSASCVQLLLSSDTSPELEDDLALRKIRFSLLFNIFKYCFGIVSTEKEIKMHLRDLNSIWT